MFCVLQSIGVQLFEPQRFGPPPPQTWPGWVQGPQLTVLPQPSGTMPHCAPCEAQSFFVQAGVTHALLMQS